MGVKKTGHNMNCLQCGKSFYVSGWALKKGRGKYCTMKCYQVAEKGRVNPNIEGLKLGRGWNKGIPNYSIRGEKHHMWKGGKVSLKHKIRCSNQYFEWRISVFERDNFTCQNCGKRQGNINADHIKAFSIILEEYNIKTLDDAYSCNALWDINNGRTLCELCHKNTDNYGWKLRWGYLQ